VKVIRYSLQSGSHDENEKEESYRMVFITRNKEGMYIHSYGEETLDKGRALYDINEVPFTISEEDTEELEPKD